MTGLDKWPYRRTHVLCLMDRYGVGEYRQTKFIIREMKRVLDIANVKSIYRDLYTLYEEGYLAHKDGEYSLTREGSKMVAIIKGGLLD